MNPEDLERKVKIYIELNKQIKNLKKTTDNLKTNIKGELIKNKKELLVIGKFRISLTHIKQDRLDKDKIVKYVDNTGGNMNDMYKTIEFDRLDVIEISDSLEMVSIDL